MATAFNCVEFWFPILNTAANNTDVNIPQMTVYLPETTKSFRKVYLEIVYHDANTTLSGTCSRRQVSLQLGAAGYSAVNDTTVQTFSGENYIGAMSGDFTAYFNTNWSGSSMTCDARFLYFMSTATPLGARNISAKLVIAYTYDDTSTTRVKTIWYPLDAPRTALGTTKPAVIKDIPAWDAELPEPSKNIRQVVTVVQGNTHGNTADQTITWQYDSLTSFVSQSYEHGGGQSMAFRIHNVETYPTNAIHSFYLWGSVAAWNHLQAWTVITYEYSTVGITTVWNSVQLLMEFASPMGGITASDYQRGKREFWVQEPNTITLKASAFFMFWEEGATMAGLNMRIGTGSFLTYTDLNMATAAGGTGCMIINPVSGGISLARGRNEFSVDIYNTDTQDLGFNLSGFWMINYTSGVASQGVHAHNHTIIRNMKCYNTGGIAARTIIAADAPDIPEEFNFRNSIGVHYKYITNTTNNACGCTIGVERLVAEGGLEWENAYGDVGYTDAEVGIRQVYAQCRSIFKRWTNDADTDRLSFETSRRWRTALGNGALSFDHFDIIFTYHTITFTVAGTITGFTGNVTINLHRAANGEKVLTTTRTGDGVFSFVWYDNTEEVYVEVIDESGHYGRSSNQLAV